LVQLWDVETGKPGGEFKEHVNRVCGLAFSSDGKLLVTGDTQSTIRIWNVKDAKKLQEIDNKSLTESLTLAFAADNKSVICSGAWTDSSYLPKKGQKFKINDKEITLDDDFVLDLQGVKMTRKEGDYVMQWDVESGKEVRKFGGLRSTIRSLAYSADGKLVAAADKDGKIC